MAEEYKHTTKSEVMKQNLKEDFAMNIMDPIYRLTGLKFPEAGENICDVVCAKFDEEIDQLTYDQLEDLFYDRFPGTDI